MCALSFTCFLFLVAFHVDAEQHDTSRQYLMHLLMPDHPNEGRIFFTVVSEPVHDEEEDCKDVGIAYVDLIQVSRDRLFTCVLSQLLDRFHLSRKSTLCVLEWLSENIGLAPVLGVLEMEIVLK